MGKAWLQQTVILARFLAAWLFTLAYSCFCCVLAALVGPTRMWLIVRVFWARATLKILGVRLHLRGAENLARGPAVFVSNHQSLMDVVFLPAILPRRVRFVAKRELLWVPFWGWAFAAGGALLIDRSRPRQALYQLGRAMARLPPDWSVIVFPEGTRSPDGRLLPFKRGAFHMAMAGGRPVVPIGLSGARDIVAPDGWLVRGGDVWVDVGEPLPTEHWTAANLAAQVRVGEAAVADCLVRAGAARQAQRGEVQPAKLLSNGAMG